MDNGKIDIATKYQVELNSKYSDYSKQGSNNGRNTAETILKIMQQQSNQNNKKSEWLKLALKIWFLSRQI